VPSGVGLGLRRNAFSESIAPALFMKASPTPSARPSRQGKSPKFDLYQTVTDQICALLAAGTCPWKSPYLMRQAGPPMNFLTRKAYRGINVFLLSACRSPSPYFLTFLQAKELGGHVRKGESGFLVVKYGTYNKETTDNTGETTEEQRRYLKGYTVFNACQIEGIEFPDAPEAATWTEDEACQRAASLITAMPNPPTIRENASRIPCYNKALDLVKMPDRGAFATATGFFSTLLHELAHSTGHEKRLARKTLTENLGIDTMGEARKIYSQEELVAEMACAFLCAHVGLGEELENSAAYLSSWLKVLQAKEHKTWIVKAASEAQKAADYILNTQPEDGKP
jgi:antirestriction protein ArdC